MRIPSTRSSSSGRRPRGAKSGEPWSGFSSMLKGEKPQSSVAPRRSFGMKSAARITSLGRDRHDVVVAIDFEAEGLLDGLPDEQARGARLDLLRTLEQEGFSPEELRQATEEGRLALPPLERVLAAEDPHYTQRELSERSGLDVEFLAEARRALGAPAVDPDKRVLTED